LASSKAIKAGCSSMAYPGAVHTRFEHSPGVMHLAGLMYDAIIENPDNRELLFRTLPYGEKRDRLPILVSALSALGKWHTP